ncbi:MAG: hypothetical protein QOJ94_610 [Sphingomonadales bacterium]|jgi:hypothetical protein|nr:hypothetical protein [Sphingomonadales bacterium]
MMGKPAKLSRNSNQLASMTGKTPNLKERRPA